MLVVKSKKRIKNVENKVEKRRNKQRKIYKKKLGKQISLKTNAMTHCLLFKKLIPIKL